MGDHIHTGRVVAEDDDILSYECERCGAEWQEEKGGFHRVRMGCSGCWRQRRH